MRVAILVDDGERDLLLEECFDPRRRVRGRLDGLDPLRKGGSRRQTGGESNITARLFGRKAKIGPFRPELENSSPPPMASIGIDSMEVPACFHNSSPVAGSYATISLEPLKINSSRLLIFMRTGFDQPMALARSRSQTFEPVVLSKAAQRERPLFWAWR